MGRKSKFTLEEKLKVVETILNGIDSACNQARLLGIDLMSIQQWICNYTSHGINGLIAANTKRCRQQSVEGIGCFRLFIGFEIVDQYLSKVWDSFNLSITELDFKV